MDSPESIETTVIAVLSDVLNEPAEQLRAEPVLAAHEWDSITSLETLVQLENRLGVSLDLRTYHTARSVGDLVGLIGRTVATTPATRS